jgi:hypothetical protein
MKSKSFALASAAAVMFITGGAGLAHAEEGDEATVHCEGVNECKGHSDCKAGDHECKGMNSCKGKGYVNMTQADCDAAKATAAE